MNNKISGEIPSHRRAFTSLLAVALAVICASLSKSALAGDTIAAPPVRLEPVTVIGQSGSLHDVASESDLVGPANQPEWTTRRAFAETDIYVIPPGEIEFNQFYISSHPRHGKPENLFESEFEFGLPWRTQFDVELNYSVNSGHSRYDAALLELPHALAEWGKVPLNPTIDAGWRFNNAKSDAYFFRLLLAEEFNRHVHFGANLTFQRQLGGDLETDYELNAALSYVAIDSKLTVGVELLVEYETDREIDNSEIKWNHSTTVMIGPTLLYKPTRNTHIGLVPLFGVTHDSPAAEAFIIFGIDFDPFARSRSTSVEADRFHPLRKGR